MGITLDQTLPLVSQPQSTGIKTVKGVSAATNGANTLAENFDNFMLLLTTQLKNQDPTSPMETNEFTQQLVAFTGVEQQILTNQYMEKQLAMNEVNQTSTAVSFIGKEVQARSDRLELKGGRGDFAFELTAPAAEVSVAIVDSAGRVVHTNTLRNMPAGRNEMIWDGSADAGGKVNDGIYRVAVLAKDVLGNPLTSKTYTKGVATGVSMVTGQATIMVNGQNIPVSDIISVSSAPVVTPPPATDTGNDNNNNTDTGNTDTGTDTGNNTGTDTGNNTGTDTDTDTETGSDTGTDTGTDTGSNTDPGGEDDINQQTASN